MLDKEIKDILIEQIRLLAGINKELSEPELVANNALAMVEIARLITLYPKTQEFDERFQ